MRSDIFNGLRGLDRHYVLHSGIEEGITNEFTVACINKDQLRPIFLGDVLQKLGYLPAVYLIHRTNLVEHFKAENSLLGLFDLVNLYQTVTDDVQNFNLVLEHKLKFLD